MVAKPPWLEPMERTEWRDWRMELRRWSLSTCLCRFLDSQRNTKTATIKIAASTDPRTATVTISFFQLISEICTFGSETGESLIKIASLKWLYLLWELFYKIYSNPLIHWQFHKWQHHEHFVLMTWFSNINK